MNTLYKRIQYLFIYDDGNLIRKYSGTGKGNIEGNIIGTLNKVNGYVYAAIDGKSYLLHRLIFLWHHGYVPEYVDHIDRDKLNNRIENLREVSKQCNGRNCKVSRRNTSGVTGVSFAKERNKWFAQIYTPEKKYTIGYFDTLLDAVRARWKKEVELNWNGCNSTSSAYLYLQSIGD